MKMRESQLSSSELKQTCQQIIGRIDSLVGRRIIVVGDIGLDQYVLGEVKRISPEAPVPVVEVKSQDARLGLAANVAQNVASLGGTACLVSVIGNDSAGDELRGYLREAKVPADHLVVDKQRPTIRKLRVMAEHHHIVRVDFELKKYLTNEIEQQVLGKVRELLPTSDGVILEDYAKGVLSEPLVQQIIKEAHALGKTVMVDPNRTTPAKFYEGIDLLTPNRDEAVALSGLDADELRISENMILELGHHLRDKVKAKNLVITRGKEGMSLFTDKQVLHLPTFARQVFDVTGAGDTVIAALALAWGGGWSLTEACVLANFAAGVVVGKVGSVPCSKDELLAYMRSQAGL